MALEHAANVDGMYIDESENGLSFHKHGDLLLVSGGWHVLQGLCRKALPKGHGEIPLGYAGLYKSG